MLTNTTLSHNHPLRDTITKAYRMDESDCLYPLIAPLLASDHILAHIANTAKQLITETRLYKKRQSNIDKLIHQYDLSTDEGIALMCLAEALLRIPDKATMDKLIGDKISTVEWKNHLSKHNPLFVNAATWSLLLTGKLYAPTISQEQNWLSALTRTTSRLGTPLVRPLILQMMKAMGKQFVMGENIEAALTRAIPLEQMGYRFSYDMLGEAARTAEEANHYYEAYVQAIHAIGKMATAASPEKNPGISIKLSALHPRYEFTQRERVLSELPPRLLALAQLAKRYNIGLTVDAEEADRLDLSLDIFEIVYSHDSLSGWEGFGLAVQAYQKRAFFVIDWLAALAQKHGRRLMVRLVKGAYWDAEIKMSQVQGMPGYPVFTRKQATDVSYLACANKLLAQPHYFYPQFGTHNAYSVAAIMAMADKDTPFEFQCLHGMGRSLYDQIVVPGLYHRPCRIYAPVGTHKDLLGYLVRRLLENGANTSFVNRLADEKTPVEEMVENPVTRIAALQHKPHPRIPLPKDIYGHWQNSQGIDLSNQMTLQQLKEHMEKADKAIPSAGPIINGKLYTHAEAKPVLSPSQLTHVVGHVSEATEEEVDVALNYAVPASQEWGSTPVTERAAILERAAELFQRDMPRLMTVLSREGGICAGCRPRCRLSDRPGWRRCR